MRCPWQTARLLTRSMQILLATSNPHKVREITELLAPLGVRLHELSSVSRPLLEPEENGESFEANARLKARSYAQQTGLICLAEDSGLEVLALGGAPGVHSAYYAGTAGNREERDRANNDKLLAAIRNVPRDQRQARFVCVAVVAEPGGNVLAEARGSYAGVITDQPRGSNGFGYDPLLYLPDVGLTSAELDSQQKHARSHRGAAFRQLASHLKRLLARDSP